MDFGEELSRNIIETKVYKEHIYFLFAN